MGHPQSYSVERVDEMKRKSEEWMRDVEGSQRNIVFPDTALNEARLWQNLIHGKRHLGAVHIVVIVLVCGVLAAPIRDILKALTSIVGWAFLGGCGALFLLLR